MIAGQKPACVAEWGTGSARTGRAYLRRRASRSFGQVLVDQRVRELPLRAGKLDAVALDGRRRRANGAQLLPLGHEICDPGSK